MMATVPQLVGERGSFQKDHFSPKLGVFFDFCALQSRFEAAKVLTQIDTIYDHD